MNTVAFRNTLAVLYFVAADKYRLAVWVQKYVYMKPLLELVQTNVEIIIIRLRTDLIHCDRCYEFTVT